MGSTLLFLWVSSVSSYFCHGGKALIIKHVVGVLIGDIKILHVISLFSGVVPFPKALHYNLLIVERCTTNLLEKRRKFGSSNCFFFDVVFKNLY